MALYESLAGSVRIELVSADIPMLLESLNSSGIVVRDLKVLDLLTVHATVSRSKYKSVKAVVKQRGGTCHPLKRQGLYWPIKGLVNRPVFLSGILFLVILAFWLPTRVLFVQVEGNQNIPAKLILEYARQCGIGFGASRREVRSEKVKNSLLSSIPQLQWAGVNTYGCTAVISVKERTEENQTEEPYTVSRIVASRDGIVESCTVTRGNALCRAGQAVKAGQVLISGYTDCGISIQATRAEGEVFAMTFHKLAVASPLSYSQKADQTGSEKKYSLLIGKKRINFFKDSGISYTSCDKMYLEYYLTLPGGFQLPVALVVEEYIFRESVSVSADAGEIQRVAEAYAENYLLDQMISGMILESSTSGEQDLETFTLSGTFVCREMIGRVQNEEIMENYGKDNGKDR